MQTVNVALVGARGKMGQISQEAIASLPGFCLVDTINRGDDLESHLLRSKPHVAIELTSAEHVFANTQTILRCGVRPLVGSSGLSSAQTQLLQKLCADKQLGGLIVPNFSLAFAILQNTLRQFAEFYDDISFVEFHHAQKKDKPSGTARFLAQLTGVEESEIASIRSNGFLAKQQVYINSPHERIIIDHESFHRKSFERGIQLCLKRIMALGQLVVGLESLLAGGNHG